MPISICLPSTRRTAPLLLLLACGLLLGSLAQAAPAPWYWGVSRLDGQRVCAQHMPEQGWERAQGPFARAGCQR